VVIYDTYAWVEYFRGSNKGKIVRDLLEVEDGYTPSITLAELARKYLREGFTEEELRKRLRFIEAKTVIIQINSEIAIKAAKIYLQLHNHALKEKLRTPSLADAIVYATTKTLNKKLVTGDKLFQKLPSIIYLE